MKYFCASLAFFLSLALGSVQAATYQPLLEATELSEALAARPQLQIIDIRSPDDYAAAIFQVPYRLHTGNGADLLIIQDSCPITLTLKSLYVNSA